MRDKLLFEFGDATAEVFDLAALFRQFLCRGLEFDTLGVAAIFNRLDLVAGGIEPVLERLDLSLERDDVELLRVGEAGALVQLAHQLGEFGFLVGQRALRIEHDAAFDGEFFFGGAQLVAQRLVARFEREKWWRSFRRARS